MPFNLLKTYSDLLEISHLDSNQRKESLRGIFNKDIQDNLGLSFRAKIIRPVKKVDGQSSLDVLFNHLITHDISDAKGRKTGAREFEINRSIRLHWVRYHIEESKQENIAIFSYLDRINGTNVIRTYIYDKDQRYVVILEPQKSQLDYYLITAYHLDKDFGFKQIEKKLKNKLEELH